jgi:hypothetical protein
VRLDNRSDRAWSHIALEDAAPPIQHNVQRKLRLDAVRPRRRARPSSVAAARSAPPRPRPSAHDAKARAGRPTGVPVGARGRHEAVAAGVQGATCGAAVEREVVGAGGPAAKHASG